MEYKKFEGTRQQFNEEIGITEERVKYFTDKGHRSAMGLKEALLEVVRFDDGPAVGMAIGDEVNNRIILTMGQAEELRDHLNTALEEWAGKDE